MAHDVDRETVSSRFSGLSEADRDWLQAALAHPQNDDAILDGLHHYLDTATRAPFLNTLKLEKSGEWLGAAAPGRIQIRLAEAARSSQHPAYQSFRNGLMRSGGLERAYPKSAV